MELLKGVQVFNAKSSVTRPHAVRK
jgi:hypothetical protein